MKLEIFELSLITPFPFYTKSLANLVILPKYIKFIHFTLNAILF